MQMDDDSLLRLARERLSDKRFFHTVSVAEEARRLANRLGADPVKAYTAGLLHDMTKEIDTPNQLKLCKKFDILLSETDKASPKILHAVTAEAFARRELGFTDEEILGAVRWHTTGRADMTLLEKILYIADCIEPLRTFKGVETIRELAAKDLTAAVRETLDMTIREVLARRSVLTEETVEARNWLLLHADGGETSGH